MSLPSELLRRAYAACDEQARSHYENFPVASRLLPRATRPHVAAVYAFARIADDIADEGSAQPADRIERLEAWERRLHTALAPERSSEPPRGHDELVAVAVANSIRTLDLPISLFDDLLSAFRQDTMTMRYTSWADVFDYCRRSANPIGRLVLRIAGYREDALDRSSDALCTALQLTNFWQDFGSDWRAGRLYVPVEVQKRFGAGEEQLRDRALGDAWVRAIGECVRVTRERFQAGRDVCVRVRGRLRYELRFTWVGGHRVLQRVDAMRQSLMTARPTLGASDIPLLLWRVARWSAQV
jgi:squalene synthase HpnC